MSFSKPSTIPIRKGTNTNFEKQELNVHITENKNGPVADRFKFGEIESKSLVGVCTGLAWTEVGGELLQIESVIMPGKGKAYYTGKLGDVMKESVQAAQSAASAFQVR